MMIRLADGARWCIRAGHPLAADVVKALGAAMRLQPGTSGRELLVTIGRAESPPANLSGPGPAVITILPPTNVNLLTSGMLQIGLAIGQEIQSRGGLLVHGALVADPKGEGVILAGVGGVGKTTASRRLSDPWRALSDDAALIVRDRSGRYWAHAWPTWSRFYTDKGVPGPGGSWDVQRPVPLRGVFILSRSPEDSAVSLAPAPATAMLMDVVQHVSHTMRRHLTDVQIHSLHQQQLTAVEDLVRAVPVFRFGISLTGAFWNEIDRVLENKDPSVARSDHLPVQPPAQSIETGPKDSSASSAETLFVAYTGPSMNPTLREPDLLTVLPYKGPVQVGDVICYQCPERSGPVVHRVISVTAAGIRTRGDNNRQEDPGLVQPEAVMGRVVSARRRNRRRCVAGGRSGRMIAAWCRFRVFARPLALWPVRSVYNRLADTGLFQKMLPPGFRPRVFVFTARRQSFFKLILKDRVIGHYDPLRENWHIRRPFRLFVDPTGLPCPEPDDK